MIRSSFNLILSAGHMICLSFQISTLHLSRIRGQNWLSHHWKPFQLAQRKFTACKDCAYYSHSGGQTTDCWNKMKELQHEHCAFSFWWFERHIKSQWECPLMYIKTWQMSINTDLTIFLPCIYIIWFFFFKDWWQTWWVGFSLASRGGHWEPLLVGTSRREWRPVQHRTCGDKMI